MPRRFLLFLFSFLAVTATAQFTLDNIRFNASRQSRSDYAEIVFNVDAAPRAEAFVAALGADPGAASGSVLRWDAKGLRLTRHGGGAAPQVVLQSPAALPETLLRQGGAVVFRARQNIVEVFADGIRHYRGVAAFSTRGQIALPEGRAYLPISAVSYQRLEPFQFGDDFMRTEEEAKQWGLWQPLSGDWKIYSVMERIEANPDARIRDGREPRADRSPNPFCLSGKAPTGEGLITAGQDFWCDYEVAVSVKPFGAAFGLAFAVRDADNYWLLRWRLSSLGTAPAPLQLLRRQGGVSQTVAEIPAAGRLENWWRLAVRLRGDEITVLLDSQVVHTLRRQDCPGGRIGLYVQGEQETYFDDVEVRSLTDIGNDPALLATTGASLRGAWKTAGAVVTAPSGDAADNALPLYRLGFADWPAQRFAAGLSGQDRNGPTRARAGLAFAITDQDNCWQTVWKAAPPPQPSTLELGRWAKGRYQAIATLPWSIPPEHLAVDCRQDSVIEVWADHTLALRHCVPAGTALGGCVGLIGTRGTAFTDITAFAEQARDWEKPVDIQRFADDPFMQGWASSRYAWLREPGTARDAFPQRHTFTGDLYGAFVLEAPLQPGLNYHFGEDQPDPAKGYLLTTTLDEKTGSGTLTLSRAGKKLASAPFSGAKRTVIPGTQIVDEKIGERPRTPDTVSWGRLSLHRDGHAIWAALDGKELFSVLEPHPLAGRAFAVDIPAPLDFIHLDLRRESLRDYLFEKAETDWSSLGAWEVTNRFACDPRWSHMNGESRGVAALWSKFNLIGDYTIECFAGMRMRQGELKEDARISYPRVGDINVALNADGVELFSGYNVIIAAWDKDWSETWTLFHRRGDIVERTDKELIPRGRYRSPGSRAITLDWDPGGRPVHGAWYALKIRRTGSRFDVSFDNIPVFSYEDSSPLPDGRIALWTQFNSIVLARMKVSYRQLQPVQTTYRLADLGPAASKPSSTTTPPVLDLRSHDAMTADFEAGLDGFAPWNGDQSAELTTVPGPKKSTVLQAVNCNSGGDFGIRVPMTGKRLERVDTLAFDVQIPAGVLVNLYFTVKEDPIGHYFIALSGPSEDQSNLHGLGRFEGFQAGQWSHVSFRLAEALRRRFPWRNSWIVDSMAIGMLHEGYLNAGLGGNQAGAVYRLDNFTATGFGPLQVEGAFTAADGGQAPAQVRAWLSRNARSKAPASATAAQGASFSLTSDKPGPTFLHLETSSGNAWQRHPAVPIILCAPLATPTITPGPNEAWGFNPIKVTFPEHDQLRPLPSTAKFTVAGIDIPVNHGTTAIEDDGRTLVIQPLASDLHKRGQGQLAMTFAWKNNLEGQAAKAAELKWNCQPKPELDRTPPGPVILEPSRHSLRGLRAWEQECELAAKSGAELELYRRKDGAPAARVYNRICGASSGLNFNLPTFPIGSFPVLTFDYNIPPKTYVDLSFAAVGRHFTLGLTDKEHKENLGLGDVDGIVADGTWRRATVNIAERFRQANTLNWDIKDAKITSVSIGNWLYSGAAPGCNYEVSNVALAPLVATVDKPFRVTWYAVDAGGVKGYSYKWDDQPDTAPPKKVMTTDAALEVKTLPDGLQVLHVRACDLAGNWGPTSHFPFQVDNRRPQPVKQQPPVAETPIAAIPEKIAVTFQNSDGWVNFDSARLDINGKDYPLQRHVSDWNHATATFTWDLLADWSLLRGKVADQQPFTATLSGLKTAAGTAIPDTVWRWKIDYSLDTTPPGPPLIIGGNNVLRRHETFASGRPWTANPNAGATRVLKDDITGSECLEITFDAERHRRFLVSAAGSYQLDPEATPFLRFRYRLTKGSQVNLLASVDQSWYSITMTGPEHENTIGTIADVQADDQWHWAMLELAPLLAKVKSESKEKPIFRSLAFGLLAPVPKKAVCKLRLDDFSLVSVYGPLPFFSFSSADATGIAAYEAKFSRQPDDVPTSDMTPPSQAQSDIWLSAADAEGLWFVHVRGRDGAGNRGETVHAPYYCRTPATPAAEGDGLERSDAEYPWRLLSAESGKRTPHPRHLLHKVKAGVNQLLAIQFRAGKLADSDLVRPFGKTSAAVSKITVDVLIQEDTSLRLHALRRNEDSKDGGVSLSESVKVSDVGVWQRNLTLTFSKPVTFGSGDLIGFRIETIGRKAATVLFDNVRVE